MHVSMPAQETRMQPVAPGPAEYSALNSSFLPRLLWLQMPTGSRGIPPLMLSIMRSCRGGVLVFQEATAGDKSAVSTQFKENEGRVTA